MRIHCLLVFFYLLVGHTFAQQFDVEFSRDGLLVLKELGMESSHIIDFDVVAESKINVLYEADSKKNLVRLHKNGMKETDFFASTTGLNNEYTIPVAIDAKLDGSVLVLSNFWNGHSWMVSVNEFYEDGNMNVGFGSSGYYKKNIMDNFDDNYGQSIHASANDEIIVVAKVQNFTTNSAAKKEKIGILKLSNAGETLSSGLYDDHNFTLNCAAMDNDQLLLAYSESIDDGQEQATYLASLDSDQMAYNKLDCITIEENYQSFDHIVLSNEKLYTSQMEDDSEGVYHIRKYDVEGNRDTSFFDMGKMSYSADIYNTNFVVNKSGEIFIISSSLDNEFEILIKKLLSTGEVDTNYGVEGVTSLYLKYPILDLSKMHLDYEDNLYISGAMRIEGSSYGFISKVKLNIQELKREKLEKFLDNLFKKE
ncbi:hypothetical protein [Aquimarina litoralis]|uniref:hypothetical protein n=1 Tax=Aquimarina litoralis TaxID=584605 RepID=UPI001C5A49E9|nr:hypothetical protein [Aquimarina litoralis]MBW1298086.1 hypothetical protein [Aquimarina litoralis]